MEDVEPRKNSEGKWLVLPEEKKKELTELTDDAIKYEATLASTGDVVDFFVSRMMDRTKSDVVTLEKAKAVLRALSIEFDEKKTIMTNALDKIAEINSKAENIISELAPERFHHRIENFQEVMEKFEPHVKRFENLVKKIEEHKKTKLEDAKAAILRGHRKGYFDNLQ